MSTLKATNIKNESSASNNIVLDSGGGVVVNNGVTLGTGTTISSPASDTFIVSTNGSERLRVDSSGRLAVGTTSPAAPLHVEGNDGIAIKSSAQTNAFLIRPSSSSADGIRFTQAGGAGDRMAIDSSGRLLVGTSTAPAVGASANARAVIQGNSADSASSFVLSLQRGEAPTGITSGEYLGQIMFAASDGSPFAEIAAVADANAGTDDYPGRLVFSTTADGAPSPTERMRITSYGKTLINRTAATAGSTAGLEIQGSAVDTNYTFAVYDATGSDRVISVRNDNYLVSTTTYARTTAGAANIHIDSAGFMFRSTSSIKYKTDVETIEDVYSEALLNCRPVWYRSTSERDNPQWGWWGFIAEEVAEIDPRLVHWKTITTELDENGELQDVVLDNPEPEGVQYDRFVPHLLNLIKRQKEQIEAMEARLSALEAS